MFRRRAFTSWCDDGITTVEMKNINQLPGTKQNKYNGENEHNDSTWKTALKKTITIAANDFSATPFDNVGSEGSNH